PRVDAHRAAETATGLARADRRVERERVRDRRRKLDVALGTVQPARETQRRAAVRAMHGSAARAQGKRGLERLDQPGAILGLEGEPVLHDLDRRLAACVDTRIALTREKA